MSFWLQFSIADIEAKQFNLAAEHLKTSREMAKLKPGFDTYQIDNVEAHSVPVSSRD
jgi:hypothetical protein